MTIIEMVQELQPVHITHDAYKRECRYTRGVNIPQEDFEALLDGLNADQLEVFGYHNFAKKIEPGTYLNGYAGLAQHINQYYSSKNIEIPGLLNGKDFYVKIV